VGEDVPGSVVVVPSGVAGLVGAAMGSGVGVIGVSGTVSEGAVSGMLVPSIGAVVLVSGAAPGLVASWRVHAATVSSETTPNISKTLRCINHLS
jgi:hypothetical protein